ncbi:vacuolar protein sorting-associated protein 11 homolog isoform X2 [Ischnura elegans]|uniref:vacuolar protein sorting-associated protein 11 homolog isoform X2 n=1 Tax=Ischnura elegans TaxID=197161 RepID=UPI001ED88E9B|nr:vacuolar protein sorting-associated protein 11 homolog isoform X2 [Ischnura elegans]
MDKEWKRFNFFDLVSNVDNGALAAAIQDARITAYTCGHGHIVFADSLGNVHLVDRIFQITTFPAYAYSVDLCEQIRNAPLLVTVGGDEPGAYPLIKVWNLEKRDKGGLPICVRTSRATSGGHVAHATALCAHSNLELMAIGFSDSTVILYRGDITRDRSVKQKVLGGKDGFSGGNVLCSVTGLAFRSTHGARSTFLFVATSACVYICNISIKDKEQKVTLDSEGCKRMCSVIAENAQESHFMVGRADAIYCYTPDGRGPCYVVEGEKILLHWFRSYLVIVAKEGEEAALRALPPVTQQGLKPFGDGNESGKSGSQGRGERCTVNILDILNKCIVLAAPMNGVRAVISEWGSIYVVVGGAGTTEPLRICHLVEKDLQSKLAFLFKKNLYDVSIRIAKSQQYDVDGLVDIFRQYGDHLYSKGEHNAAIDQYIKTIGKLESSYVIRKFLDSQHIGHLTKYLQALHKQGMASEDHTTLLLNCYTKQDSTDKLKDFLMTKDREVDFDVEIAIKVCREASPEDALLLARKHHLHQWYLKILIEDQHNYIEALDYIAQLEFEEAEENVKEYGSILVDHVPEQTTELLKKLCYEYRPSKKPLVDQSMIDGLTTVPETKSANAEKFILLFLNNSERLVEFLEHIVSVCPNSSTQVYSTLVEHYLHIWSCMQPKIKGNGDETQETTADEDDDRLEERKRLEGKLMAILKNPDSKYDKNQTLILCRVHNFKPGLLFLYEDFKLYQEIINYHAQYREYSSILECCRKFDHKNKELWVQALWVCAKDPEVPASALREVLDVIAKKQLLSPLLVVDALSSGSGPNAGMTKIRELRSFLSSVLSAEGDITEKEKELVGKYQKDTEEYREAINNIQTSTIIFQGSRCSACDNQLNLPSIHFFCQHSYHQHCFQSFSENENECPACLRKNKSFLERIESQEQRLCNHDSFHSDLEKAEDGFTWVADYFGRGVFNRLMLVTDSPPRSALLGTPSHEQYKAPASSVADSRRKQDMPSLSTFPQLQSSSATALAKAASSSNYHDSQPTLAANITTSLRLGVSPVYNKYNHSVESNVVHGSDIPSQSSKLSTQGKSEPTVKPTPTNPFGDYDEDEIGMHCSSKGQAYDERKNPFAEDSNNPFENDKISGENFAHRGGGDYLNPFA